MIKYLLAAWLGIAPLLCMAQPNPDVIALVDLLEQFEQLQGKFLAAPVWSGQYPFGGIQR